jgi:hypothetical protein
MQNLSKKYWNVGIFLQLNSGFKLLFTEETKGAPYVKAGCVL